MTTREVVDAQQGLILPPALNCLIFNNASELLSDKFRGWQYYSTIVISPCESWIPSGLGGAPAIVFP